MFDIVVYRKAYYRKNKKKIAKYRNHNKKHTNILRNARNKINKKERAKTRQLRLLTEVGKLNFTFNRRATVCRKAGGNVKANDLRQIYLKQKGKCALTGRNLICRAGKFDPDCLSVDRIKHGKPYTVKNIRLVTWQANCARGLWSDVELIQFCRDVIKHSA